MLLIYRQHSRSSSPVVLKHSIRNALDAVNSDNVKFWESQYFSGDDIVFNVPKAVNQIFEIHENLTVSDATTKECSLQILSLVELVYKIRQSAAETFSTCDLKSTMLPGTAHWLLCGLSRRRSGINILRSILVDNDEECQARLLLRQAILAAIKISLDVHFAYQSCIDVYGDVDVLTYESFSEFSAADEVTRRADLVDSFCSAYHVLEIILNEFRLQFNHAEFSFIVECIEVFSDYNENTKEWLLKNGILELLVGWLQKLSEVSFCSYIVLVVGDETVQPGTWEY